MEVFKDTTVKMPDGETVTMRLAEMGSHIGSGEKLWGARDPKIDRLRSSDQSDQHRIWTISRCSRCPDVQPMVSGKLLPLHDAALCHRPDCGVWERMTFLTLKW